MLSLRVLLIGCFLALVCLSAPMVFLFRHRIAFRSMYGLPIKKADQNLIDSKINGLREFLSCYRDEKGNLKEPTQNTSELAYFAEKDLNRAIDLALRYNFKVPQTLKVSQK